MFHLCGCRHRSASRACEDEDEVRQEVEGPPPRGRSSGAAPTGSSPAASSSAPAGAVTEDRVCPLTGAVGYCPMAKPGGARARGEKLPELKVLMLLVWEANGSKVSVGVYPHMSRHWEALELPDTSTKEEIRKQFHKLSVKHHPDKSPGPGATERFQRIVEAHQALKDTDGELAFPWERHPERQQVMTGMQVLRTFGPLAQEAANTDPIKAQMMQHVVKESTDCKVLIFERETTEGGSQVRETWADALCTDARNGSNHLVKVYRRIAVSGTSKGEDRILPSEESEIDPSDFDVVD